MIYLKENIAPGTPNDSEDKLRLNKSQYEIPEIEPISEEDRGEKDRNDKDRDIK